MDIFIKEITDKMDSCANLEEILKKNGMDDFKPEVTSCYPDHDSQSAIRGLLSDLGFEFKNDESITIVAYRIDPPLSC